MNAENVKQILKVKKKTSPLTTSQKSVCHLLTNAPNKVNTGINIFVLLELCHYKLYRIET